MRTLKLAALAAFLLATPAAAQQRSDGLTGTRVRVTAPNFLPSAITGTVTSYTREGIVVAQEANGDSILLPLRAVSRLDKFAGGSAGSTAWYRGRVGAFIGAGLGLVVGPVSAKLTGRGMGESALLGGAIGLGAGFGIGAALGAAAPRERWTWTIAPWGYDATLRPAPAQIPPPPPVPQPQPEPQTQPQTPQVPATPAPQPQAPPQTPTPAPQPPVQP